MTFCAVFISSFLSPVSGVRTTKIYHTVRSDLSFYKLLATYSRFSCAPSQLPSRCPRLAGGGQFPPPAGCLEALKKELSQHGTCESLRPSVRNLGRWQSIPCDPRPAPPGIRTFQSCTAD